PPVVNHRFEKRAISGQMTVDAPLPACLPAVVEFLLMAVLQETLALTVADLLSPISFDRVAMMVPDQRARTEGQMPAALLQSPAGVPIVTGHGLSRVEAAHFLERPATERHVAAWNVLGDGVVEQHLRRPAGASRDALRDPTVVLRDDVRPAHAERAGRHERL